jgi:hypothetical protein
MWGMRRTLLSLVVALLLAAFAQMIVRLCAPHAPEIVPRLVGNGVFALVLAGIVAANRKIETRGRGALAAAILFVLLNLACVWAAVAGDSMLALLLLFPILTIGYYPPLPDPEAALLWALTLPVPIAVGAAIGLAWRRSRPPA